MIEAEQIMREAASVLVVDWPSREVPDTLARAGFEVTVQGGPGPEEYSVYECDEVGEIVVRRTGIAPVHVDVVYTHRPLPELPAIVRMARTLGALCIWLQSGMDAAGTKDPTGCWLADDQSAEGRHLVEAVGLAYVDRFYIADVVRQLGDSRNS